MKNRKREHDKEKKKIETKYVYIKKNAKEKNKFYKNNNFHNGYRDSIYEPIGKMQH